LDALEGESQQRAPSPVVLEAQDQPAAAGDQAASAVEEPVAQGAGLPEPCPTVQADTAEVAEQIVRGQHQLQPAADAVLAAGPGAVTSFEQGDVLLLLVGDEE
jgi:hypothetical protein